jgi:DNA-binding LytR/AlgR family response regulator
MPPPGRLAGLKVLVVEDNYLIAEHVRSILDDQGCEVLGPVARVAAGLALIEHGPRPDCALLDVNLNGELCFPLARALAGDDVPVVLLTGYDDRAIIPEDFAPAAVLGKPLEHERLVGTLAAACARGKGQ